ncbi:MAG TPA: hypothetical protein VF188_09440 [Longimicrobiales bacterium]
MQCSAGRHGAERARRRFGAARRLGAWRHAGPFGRAVALLLLTAVAGCSLDAPANPPPRTTIVIGVDVSGSFRSTGHYDDALSFTARYIYGHMNGLGGLEVPRALFVGAIGGEEPGEPQAFHPIHDFRGHSVAEIEKDLREWFQPDDRFTDFNAFFRRAATLVKRQNLTLAPITLVVLSDGVPDLTARGAGRRTQVDDPARYEGIELGDLEYLARNVTVRLLYPDPPVAVAWERHVPRGRVRLWTVDHVVMAGWHEQMLPDSAVEAQDALWKWVRDNVDFRVRRSLF